MFIERPKVESRPCTPWTKFHYAILNCRGIGFLFDTLRYENAFFCRWTDLDVLKAAMKGLQAVNQTFAPLLCKFGEGKPNWTEQRLMSAMRLEIVPFATVFALDSDFTVLKPNTRLKYQSETQVTGLPDAVLDTMFLNHAFPASETDSHIIEQVPFCSQDETITVTLRTFSPVPDGWDFRKLGAKA